MTNKAHPVALLLTHEERKRVATSRFENIRPFMGGTVLRCTAKGRLYSTCPLAVALDHPVNRSPSGFTNALKTLGRFEGKDGRAMDLAVYDFVVRADSGQLDPTCLPTLMGFDAEGNDILDEVGVSDLIRTSRA